MIIVLDIIFEFWGVDPRVPFKSSTSKKVSFLSGLLIGIFIRDESFLVGESVEGSSFIIGSNNEDLQEVNTRNNIRIVEENCRALVNFISNRYKRNTIIE